MSEVPPASGPSSSSSSPFMTDVMALRPMPAIHGHPSRSTTDLICSEDPRGTQRFIIDTWQYFLHRFMHVNKWFYKHFHSPIGGIRSGLAWCGSRRTVDGRCGYKLPFDPLQLMSGNNADYHDIHHQQIGIKSNFAQPFFMHWDVLLGTRMT
ncbi:hypothetical protein K435DRAFT_963942 [Dendrothele bispora CBS 962.96]|uniref:Fatty acid hydroxylase domain-containing protein n=1 Tax=Dendrothele bispora (strain CBS 962.96) TaxID=1314807 RepID=A0A4S8MD91_DENBC|nr:hypothetical protein K435DRAFT_963942 [Dendrothele bispora CBS 962.96]